MTTQPALPALRKTEKRPKRSGRIGKYPTLDDLIEYAINVGWVGSREELLDHRTGLIPTLFYFWAASGQLACQFAIRMAKQWQRARWETYLIDSPPGLGLIGRQIDEILEARIEQAEAVQFLLPQASAAGDIVDVIDDLCRNPRWFWREEESTDADIFNVGLRWVFPDDEHVSWVLGFANLGSITPYTRKGPFTALVLRPSVVDANGLEPKHDTDGRTAIHLAHMTAMVTEGETVYEGPTWSRSVENKADILNGELVKGARARVTFSLPSSVRSRLETPPKSLSER